MDQDGRPLSESLELGFKWGSLYDSVLNRQSILPMLKTEPIIVPLQTTQYPTPQLTATTSMTPRDLSPDIPPKETTNLTPMMSELKFVRRETSLGLDFYPSAGSQIDQGPYLCAWSDCTHAFDTIEELSDHIERHIGVCICSCDDRINVLVETTTSVFL